MSKTVITNLVLVLAIMLLLPNTHSTVPLLISYQGLLKNSAGDPLDGTIEMTFRIWNNSSGGSLLWDETHLGVVVTEGLFKVALGSQEGGGLPQSVFSGSEVWLETIVNGEAISPRTQFTTNAFSHRVSTVDGANSGILSGDLTVTGKVMATAAIEPLGGIITPGGITIQSTGNNVLIIAGSSVITVSPSGGVTIQGTSVGINATGVLTLSATSKVAINAPWVDLRSDSLVAVSNMQTRVMAGSVINAQASTNLNLTAGGQGNITAGGNLDLNGSTILLN